jgi:hypothetical protein
VQRLGDAVLVQGAAVHDLAYPVTLGLRYRALTDGLAPTTHHRQLFSLLNAVATDVSTDVPRGQRTSARTLIRQSQGWRSIANAAARSMGITARQVRRLADGLGGRLIGRVYVGLSLAAE